MGFGVKGFYIIRMQKEKKFTFDQMMVLDLMNVGIIVTPTDLSLRRIYVYIFT